MTLRDALQHPSFKEQAEAKQAMTTRQAQSDYAGVLLGVLHHPGWPQLINAIDACIAQKKKDGGFKSVLIAAALAAHDASDCFATVLGEEVGKPYTEEQARSCKVAMQELAVSFSQSSEDVINAC